MSKKILILTASPVRDVLIDNMIKEELERLGHKVWVCPCLREGRDAVLKYKPDIVVVPPIRNPYSRDFVEVCKSWGCGVISRHTEPSCDWADFKKGDERMKSEILGRWRYNIDKELVWGDDEVQILDRRKSGFPAISMGAIGLDVYFNKDLRKTLTDKDDFFTKYKLDPTKKTVLIASPWGFADSAPDLSIDEIVDAQKDMEGQGKHLAMIEQVSNSLKDKWNILVTTHPGVAQGPYVGITKKLGIPLDSESPMMKLVLHCDALIHAGSTAAVSAHILNIPSFQYGDVNSKVGTSWWGTPDSSISKVSPYYTDPQLLVDDILKSKRISNANKKTIKSLEAGRYGKMDGKGYIRAAKEISEVEGKFQFAWPIPHNDYDQLNVFKNQEKATQEGHCGICKAKFYILNTQYMKELCAFVEGKKEKLSMLNQTFCPNCAARFIKK